MTQMNKKCPIQFCNDKIYARGLCRRHYRHVIERKHEPIPVILNCIKCNTYINNKVKKHNLCKKCYIKYWKETTSWDYRRYYKDYKERNKNKIKSNVQKWKATNKDKENAYYAEKRKNPIFRLKHNLRCRIYDELSGKIKKHKRTMELVGCSIDELKAHLESKFQPGMTWDNYGKYWVVDHIKPLCSFDLTNPQELEKACHFSNLQPLTYIENSSKATLDKFNKLPSPLS